MNIEIEKNEMEKLAEIVVQKIIDSKEEIFPQPTQVNNGGKGRRIEGIRGVAQFLKCAPSKVQQLKNEGVIPFYAIGAHKVFAFEHEIVNALRES